MEKQKSGRWGYLLCAAVLGWTLYSQIQDYRYYATLDIFSPEQWEAIAMERRFGIAMLAVLCMAFVLRFFLFDRDIGMKLLDAIVGTALLALCLAYLWVAGLSMRWGVLLVVLIGYSIYEWYGLWKARRKR